MESILKMLPVPIKAEDVATVFAGASSEDQANVLCLVDMHMRKEWGDSARDRQVKYIADELRDDRNATGRQFVLDLAKALES